MRSIAASPAERLVIDDGSAKIKRCSRPVSRILSAFAQLTLRVGETTIPLAPTLLAESSNLPGSVGRAALSGSGRERLDHLLPYLVLLHAGFCVPRLSPAARCALTAPFHPYSPKLETRSVESEGGRCIFCATFRRVAPPGSYPAHCSVEFGLSSPEGTSPLAQTAGLKPRHYTNFVVALGSGRPANCNTQLYRCVGCGRCARVRPCGAAHGCHAVHGCTAPGHRTARRVPERTCRTQRTRLYPSVSCEI